MIMLIPLFAREGALENTNLPETCLCGELAASASPPMVCIYICIYVYMYICICMYVCMYVCMYACMYVCIYIYIYICTHINIYREKTLQLITFDINILV